jgi:hypothetical protein
MPARFQRASRQILQMATAWIPAKAGMTEESAGMTEESAGMTGESAGMTDILAEIFRGVSLEAKRET